jgi:hypothetical protein
MDVGLLTTSEENNLYLQTVKNTQVFHQRKRQPGALTFTVRPALLIGKTFSLDLNIANYIDLGASADKAFLLQPGCTLRYDRIEIRARYIQSRAVGLGLNVLLGKKSKKQ